MEIPSSVREREISWVARARASNTCTRYFSATLRETRAVTLGFPSLSEPIQLPGWKKGGHTGGTVPAASPSSQSSKRRYTLGIISKSVVSKRFRMVSASSIGVGFLCAMGEVLKSASISSSMRRSFSRRAMPPS